MTVKAIKNFLSLLKNPWWRNKKKYIKFYDELPIDEHAILIESQHGNEMNGNVFYLMKELCENTRYASYTVYLSVRLGKKAKFKKLLGIYGMDKVELLVLASEEYFKALASAKYLVNDNTFLPFFIKKAGQIYLNTWHGTPLKTLGKRIKADAHAIGNAQKNFVSADYILFPNAHTRDVIIDDYMLKNISRTSYVMLGYPRNEVFFNEARRSEIKENLGLKGKRLYAYMPTFRGTAAKGSTAKNTHYLNYFLFELDNQLREDELLYVNLHPIATKNVNFKLFKHIFPFPQKYETYDFLNACDTLVSDYSSVFFDYACSRRKVILFTYDKEEYLKDRGTYLSIDEPPFPKAENIPTLLNELRSEKNYDDTDFIEAYCKYETPDASKRLLDFVVLGKKDGLEVQKIPSNDKENVFIYSGNLAGNGITASLISLLNVLDLSKRNYYITFRSELVYKNRHMLQKIPERVCYFPISNDLNLTVSEQITRYFFKTKRLSARFYMKHCAKRVSQELLRCYGNAKIDSVIQFNGYEAEIMLLFSAFEGKKSIFVHSNMLEEIRIKGNQRRDVLEYVYNRYDNVAVVTEDMLEPTCKLSKRSDNVKIVRNAIDHVKIARNARLDFEEKPYSRCNVTKEEFFDALSSHAIKFINIGRFAPEKAQDRLIRAFAKYYSEFKNAYLFIIGGYSLYGIYEKLNNLIAELDILGRVILVMNMPNPYNVLAKCDYFILSSIYEGFGLVIAEADILGKPVVSTDIKGPKTFMEKNGGVLVENSEDGILTGMKLLADGKIPPMNVDYERYNKEVISQFDSLFD